MTVTDLAGRPIEGALVRATDGDPIATSLREMPARVLLGAAEPPIVEARTDVEGRAELPPVECPSVAVSAAGRATEVRFLGREIEERSRCEAVFRLAPAYSLRGRVLDEDGHPVAQADVAALARGEIAGIGDVRLIPHATCDHAGEFTLEGIGPGDHVLAARMPGRWWAKALSFRAPGVERIDVRVPPAGVLEGTVKEQESGEPVTGARVWVSAMALYDGTQFGVVSDASGRYRFDGISAGLHCDLWAEAPGFVPARASGDRTCAGGVVPGGALRQDFVLSRGAAAEGTVTCDGAPVADAEVEVAVQTSMANEPQSVRAATGPDGTWRVEGLGAGSAVVVVRRDGFVQPDAPEPWNAGDTDFPGASKYGFLVPEAGTVRRDVLMAEAPATSPAEPESDDDATQGTRIRGRVVGPDGSPLPGAVVAVEKRMRDCFSTRSWFGWDGTDSSAVRRRTGAWDIRLWADPGRSRPSWYVAYAVSFEGGYAESALQRVPRGADEVEMLFRVGSPVRLVGRAVRAGVGVAGARVHVVSPRDRLHSPYDRLDGPAARHVATHAATDADGWFSVPVARRGRYAVHVQADDGAAARVRHVVVPGTPVEIELPVVTEIAGALAWTDGSPCAGLVVALAHGEGRWYGPDSGCVEGTGWAMSRADGTFRLRGIAVGAPVWLEVGRHRTGTIDVPTGWTGPIEPGARDVGIVVTPGRSLTGRVLRPDGRPLPCVSVYAWSGERDDRSTLQFGITDADGGFTVNALWPPPWHVEVRALPSEVSDGPTVAGPEVRVLYPGTYDDSGPVELVLDVPMHGPVHIPPDGPETQR